MNILMTGATGLLGRVLVAELLRRGHAVTALVRDTNSARKKLPDQVNLLVWDGGAVKAEIFAGVEAVIHLAGENIAAQRWSKQRKVILRDSRITSANNLARGLRESGTRLKVFLTASAVGFYGDRGDSDVTEADKPGDDFLARLCVEWEQAADQMPTDRIVKTRFGVILSSDGGFLEQVSSMFKKFGASRLGSGNQWISWIHIDDVVQVIAQALEDTRFQGVINTVSPEPVTNATMTREVGKAIAVWPGPPVPKIALRLLYGELADALLFSQRALPTKLQELGFKFKHATLPQALQSTLAK